MNGYLAATFVVSGAHGWLELIAFFLFLVATVIAYFVVPKAIWAALVSLGLALWVLGQLWH